MKVWTKCLGVALLVPTALGLGGCTPPSSEPRVAPRASQSATAASQDSTPAWLLCTYRPGSGDSKECAQCHKPIDVRAFGESCLRGDRVDAASCDECHMDIPMAKPVIYLYPPRTADVRVNLDVAGRITRSDPPLDESGGWNVEASPDGRLIDSRSGRAYPYLFWEAIAPARFDLTEGFVVQGDASRIFLTRHARQLGLNSSEARDFVDYWAPRMEGNRYNLVHFEGTVYERVVRLDVTPRPDTSIRVFMVFVPLSEPVAVRPQRLPRTPRREGFVLVEWGGGELPGR